MSYCHDVTPVAVTEGVTQCLQSRDVTWQFEDSQYSQDPKYLLSKNTFENWREKLIEHKVYYWNQEQSVHFIGQKVYTFCFNF